LLFRPRNANRYSGGFNPGDEIQAVMLAAISASRALRSSACRLDPGCSLLAVSLGSGPINFLAGWVIG